MVQQQLQTAATFTSPFSNTASSSTSTEPDNNGHCLTNNGTNNNAMAQDNLEFHDNLPLNTAALSPSQLMMMSQTQQQQQLNSPSSLVSSASLCLDSNNANSQNANLNNMNVYTQGITSIAPLVLPVPVCVSAPTSTNGIISSSAVEQQTVSHAA